MTEIGNKKLLQYFSHMHWWQKENVGHANNMRPIHPTVQDRGSSFAYFGSGRTEQRRISGRKAITSKGARSQKREIKERNGKEKEELRCFHYPHLSHRWNTIGADRRQSPVTILDWSRVSPLIPPRFDRKKSRNGLWAWLFKEWIIERGSEGIGKKKTPRDRSYCFVH